MTRFLLILLVMLWPTFAQASVDWTEGFEYASQTALEAVWGSSCIGNSSILTPSTTRAHSGSRSLKVIYNEVDSCSIIRYFNAASDTIYGRVWIYVQDFTPRSDGVGAKLIALIKDNTYPNFWWEFIGSLAWANVVTNTGNGLTGYNETGVNVLPVGQWACVEWQLTMNTPGVANGVMRTWMNGTPGINVNDKLWRGSTLDGANGPNSNVSFTEFYAQHGVGTMFYDDYAVSRDTRFNDCPGAVIDTTPPSQVTGFSVGAPSSSSLSITATNGIDVIDTGLTLRIERCTGASCSTFALAKTVNVTGGTVTTTSDTGLTASTIYCYRANNADTSGNLGAYSATACGTTSANGTRQTLATDLFPQANENPLSSAGAWLGGYTNAWDCIGVMGNLKVVSNTVQDAVIGNCATMQYAAAAAGADQWSQFTLGANTSNFHEGGAGVRVTTPPAQIGGYFCHVYQHPGNPGLKAIIFANINRAPGFNILAQTGSVTWTTGDVGRCEAQGSTIRFYQNDVLILTATDTEFTSGKTSLDIYIDAGGTPALTDMTFTGFAMGDWSSTVATTRRTLGTDTFNRANGLLGASWDDGYVPLTNLQIVSNVAEGSAVGTSYETRNDVLPNDQWAEATIGTLTGADKAVAFVAVRGAAPADFTNVYSCTWILNTDNGHTSELYGPSGLLASSAAESWASGDRARCEAEGTAIRFYRNDTLVLSVTNGALTAGRVGLGSFVPTTLANNTIDTISWGDFVTTALPTITNAVTDTTGSQLTYGSTTPTFVRVQTDTTNEVFTISTITAGRYNRAGGGWAFGLTFVCFFAQDATHTESSLDGEHQCDSLVGLTMTPDTTPPVLSAPAPSGTLATGTTSTVISMTSDELADLKYSTTDLAYASMTTSMTTADGLHHSATVTGLTDGSSQTYYVRGQDRAPALNVNPTSSIIAFQVAAAVDTTPPVLSGGSPTGTLAAGTTAVTMSVNTNEAATCKYASTAGVTYAAMATTFGTTGAQAHSTNVAGLANGTTYTRYVKCIDGAANANTSDYLITWSIASPAPDVTPPVLSGGSPSGVVATGTTSVLMSVQTNENASCKYNTVAGRAYTHPSSVLFTTGNGTTAHSTTISGLSNGNTYTRYVKCIDTALNPNPADYVITWSIAAAADVTPPVRSGGSPSGALPSGTTSVSMQVITNETATCKYGTVIGTAYASITNTFSTTGGTTHTQTIGSLSDGVTYTYYVRCQDVALNANTNDLTITWSITAAADATPPVLSGGSPNGTAFPVNTTSVSMQLSTNESATCKYGTVGGTAYASIANTFTTTGGTAHSQTIATANGTTYTYYVRCQDVATNVNASDYTITWSVAAVVTPDTTPPVLTLGGPTGTLPTTTTSVTLTVTSSEVATCKYGTIAATAYASIASTFTTTGGTTHTQTLSVAANTTYTYYVRCIDAAGNANLSDYVITWFVAAAPDVTPATLTNGAPTGTLPTFTTAVTLQVTTSEAATCKYGTIAATAYAGIANTFGTTGGTAHSQALAGLAANTTYTYYVRCSDASANANLVDYTITWFVDAAPDVIAPIRSLGSPSGIQAIGTTSVPMTLATDEDATCKFGTVANTAYASIAGTFSTTGTTTHSETVTPLVDGGSYTYYIRCIDGSANANTIDYIITWTVDADVTAPIRTAGLPSGVKVAGTTSVAMTLTTSENATCKYGIIPGTAYSAIAHTFTTTGGTGQSQTIGSLIDGQVSTYFVRCQDAAGNTNLDDYIITWSVDVVNDGTPPTAPSSLTCTTFSSSQAFCAFTAGTDAIGVTGNQATIGLDSGGVCTPATIINSAWGTTSPQPLVNLSGGLTYCVWMKAFDAAGNLSAASNTSTFTSTTVVDPIPPSTVSPFEAILGGTLYNVVGLTWQPGTDNIGILRTDIYRCTGDSCTDFNVKFSTTQTGYMDTTVAANTIYQYKAFHVDTSGNASVAPSAIVRVQTPLSTVGVIQGLCPCKNRK